MSRTIHYVTGAGLMIGVLVMGVSVVLLIAPATLLADAPLWGTLLTQGIWVLLALSGAALSDSSSLGDRLGLGRSELRTSTSVVLMVGFVALSGGLHLGLVSLELHETGALAEIDATVREARRRAPSFLLLLLAVGVAPGFGEEMLFRGLLQRGLVSRLGTCWGVLLAASLFGLAHLDLVHSSLAFLMGLYLGAVTQLAGCIRTAILCHVLNNTLGILAPGLIPNALPAGAAWAIPPLLALAGASLLYAGRARRPAGGSREEVSREDIPVGNQATSAKNANRRGRGEG